MEKQNIYPWQLPKNTRQIEEEINQGKIRRLFDGVFKFIFCKEERVPIFLDLLSAIVFPGGERVFTQAHFIDREISPERHGGKSAHLDVLAVMDNGDTVNIEVQVHIDSVFLKRVVAYTSWLHGGQLNKGKKYHEVKRTISVNILGYELFKGDERFRRVFSLREDESGELLNDDIRLIFLDVPKFVRNVQAPKTKLERWMAYLAGTGGEAMEQIAEQEPMISDALVAERFFMMDWEKRLAYMQWWKHVLDEETRKAYDEEREARIRESDARIKEFEANAEESDAHIRELEARIREREARIRELEARG